MFRWITLPVGISFSSLIVATIVLFFGNNISERFRKAELVYNSYSVDLKYPMLRDSINILSNGNIVPDYYREITIKNVGSKPSKALKLIIDFDGAILYKEIKCIETYDSIKATSLNQMQLKFDRLVSKADIKCKVWLKYSVGDFSITLIDDDGIVALKNVNEIDNTNYILRFTLIFIILILFILTYLIFIKPVRAENVVLRQRIEDVEGKRLGLENELADLNARGEDEARAANGDLISRLKAVINEHEPRNV